MRMKLPKSKLPRAKLGGRAKSKTYQKGFALGQRLSRMHAQLGLPSLASQEPDQPEVGQENESEADLSNLSQPESSTQPAEGELTD